ncbi:MAG: DUF342 domain-containing protein [Solirubrobacterales bacterium]
MGIESLDGKVEVVNGKIIIENPVGEGNPAEIFGSSKVRVFVDGNVVIGKRKVYEDSNIEIVFDENEASRELKIDVSPDEMEAHLSILYTPKNAYKLKDVEKAQLVELDAELKEKIFPPKYNASEISQELTNNNIVYGIIESNLKLCSTMECKDILIAAGKKMVQGVNDKIDIKFNANQAGKFKEDETGKVDFKSIGVVQDVKKGDIIAIKIPGTDGEEGCDIRGRVKKPKQIKKLNIKAGNGCAFLDENTIVSLMDGKPSVRNNAFSVFQFHEVNGDVDLSTGDIRFIGDISISGSVTEGMQIVSGNSVKIHRDVDGAVINAKGDVTVDGSVIRSKVYGGGEDVSRIKAMKELESIEVIIKSLIENVAQIKEHNILGGSKKDGDLIKLLIETKYKNLNVICIKTMSVLGGLYEEEKKGEFSELLRSKLLGLGPISIRHYGELDLIVEKINTLLLKIKSELSIPVTISIGYCQDSVIKSSGDIMVVGKGVYISELIANGSIKFVDEKSVARGGSLRAGKTLSCRIVGSSAGVPTKLQVDKDGSIYVDAAYQNTVFVVGQKEYTLEKPSKNIHAYLDQRGDMIVDKLLMEV